MKKLLVLLTILPFIISCNGQEKIDRKYFDIENFSENLNPDNYLKQLKVDSIILYGKQKDAEKIVHKELYDMETDEGKKFQWKQYNLEAEEKREQNVGYLNKIKLRRLQFIIYENKMVGVAGSSMFSDSTEIKETIDYLTKKYGKPINFMENVAITTLINTTSESGIKHESKDSDNSELDYYWQNQDRIIGISYEGEEGAFLTMDDWNNDKATFFPVYDVYMFNKKVIAELNNEGIEFKDFFSSGWTALDVNNLEYMIEDVSKRKK
ncbi:hypothetical protein [Niabella ginsengisoli]|uniref:DUF4837 family protein n=1 Tax=Niabella ginsengisoli TaxID=522298 RepID=A0ABS9SJW4_9BACT|nr:hypothetical protein [Niabella ginsengisoli]MCH5598663.1 hypothetical protein [Niabella ginsengisoli]